MVTFGYRYGTDNANETGTDGHLESWTLAEPIIRKQLPEIYVPIDTLKNLFMSQFTTDNRFGYDELSKPMKYYSNYVTGLSREYPIFSKINVVREGKDNTGDLGVFTSFIIWSRLEDILLLRAEALVMLNRSEDAINCLNELRGVRNLRNLSYLKDLKGDAKALLKEIFRERRRELMGEGHRWFDRIREARTVGDDDAMIKLINEGGIYWPIAEEVIRENPSITQNEYWK